MERLMPIKQGNLNRIVRQLNNHPNNLSAAKRTDHKMHTMCNPLKEPFERNNKGGDESVKTMSNFLRKCEMDNRISWSLKNKLRILRTDLLAGTVTAEETLNQFDALVKEME